MPTFIGIDNHNWWNIKNDPADPWKGSVGSDPDEHAIFPPAQEFWAARAFVRNSYKMMIEKGHNTPRKFFARYTHVQKDQLPYALSVADKIKMGIDMPFRIFGADGEIFDKERLHRLMLAVPEWEICSGFLADDWVIRCGISLYERDFAR